MLRLKLLQSTLKLTVPIGIRVVVPEANQVLARDSRTTVDNSGVGSSGSEKKTVCFYCRKVGHGNLDFSEWKADGKTISESGCDNDQAV